MKTSTRQNTKLIVLTAVMSMALVNCGQASEMGYSGSADQAAQSSVNSSQGQSGAPIANGSPNSTTPGLVGPAPENETLTCAERNTEIAQIYNALAAFSEMENQYNDLCKSIALAGLAPKNYISPNVSPTIAQGPGVTDSIGGVTILRADLYYAHDVAAGVSQSLRYGVPYTLPSQLASNSDITLHLQEYRAAFDAMPTFSGPPGEHITGESQHAMSGLDQTALEDQLSYLQNATCK